MSICESYNVEAFPFDIQWLELKGAPADLCLFDLERSWRVEAGEMPGKAQNTPFDGRALEGRVLGTWKAGRRVFG